ncbi:MAG: isochorismate synthase [Chlorobiaceae bacterium]
MNELYYNIVIPAKETQPIEQGIENLKAALRDYEKTYTSPNRHNQNNLVTFSQVIHPVDLSEWLYHQTIYPKVFWMNREKDFSLAGIGIADSITFEGKSNNDEMFLQFRLAIADKYPHTRYFGGFRFNNSETQETIWQGFPSFSFVLPLVQLTFEKNIFTLSCNIWFENRDELITKMRATSKLLDELVTSTDCSALKLPELLNISYNPDEKIWTEQCIKALETFDDGSMEKIMLARQTMLEFSSTLSPLLFLLRYPYPENTIYRFYFEPAENHAFFSFSPERLYRRDANMLLTEALAGTCSKTIFTVDDHHASEALLNSEKDIREHKFVKDMIYHDLNAICSEIDMEEEVCVLQLNSLAHLYTRCTATLKPESMNDGEVLKHLHPTPAVGGVPKVPAVKHIMDLEPFSRGWYAAPVGWVSSDAAEFSVAIRSALVHGRFAYLYSGAGLVKGSEPISEWEEVEQKIGDLLTITRQKA